jgi:hypothetical protein
VVSHKHTSHTQQCILELTHPGLTFYLQPEAVDMYPTDNEVGDEETGESIGQFTEQELAVPQSQNNVSGSHAWQDYNANAEWTEESLEADPALEDTDQVPVEPYDSQADDGSVNALKKLMRTVLPAPELEAAALPAQVKKDEDAMEHIKNILRDDPDTLMEWLDHQQYDIQRLKHGPGIDLTLSQDPDNFAWVLSPFFPTGPDSALAWESTLRLCVESEQTRRQLGSRILAHVIAGTCWNPRSPNPTDYLTPNPNVLVNCQELGEWLQQPLPNSEVCTMDTRFGAIKGDKHTEKRPPNCPMVHCPLHLQSGTGRGNAQRCLRCVPYLIKLLQMFCRASPGNALNAESVKDLRDFMSNRLDLLFAVGISVYTTRNWIAKKKGEPQPYTRRAQAPATPNSGGGGQPRQYSIRDMLSNQDSPAPNAAASPASNHTAKGGRGKGSKGKGKGKGNQGPPRHMDINPSAAKRARVAIDLQATATRMNISLTELQRQLNTHVTASQSEASHRED